MGYESGNKGYGDIGYGVGGGGGGEYGSDYSEVRPHPRHFHPG